MCYIFGQKMRVWAVIITLIGVCQGDTKIWQRDVNFGNPDNWASGRVPCASDSIQFPASVSVVFMQTNITLKEIRLPLTGAIVLDSNIKIAFADDTSVEPDCDGEEQTFIHDAPKSWFDPANWAGPNGPIAVDTENVPCQYDKVVFPTGKLFYLGVDISTSIGTVSFQGEDYTSTTSFTSFLNSPAGQQQFALTNNPTIQLQNSRCGDLTGCVCGNDVETVRTKICGVRSNNCPLISCREAPTPVGGCCPICGAILTMEYKPKEFHFESMKMQIDEKFGLGSSASSSSNTARKKRQADSGVQMYMSKTSQNRIQMVFTDSNAGSSSGQAAISMALDVNDDIMRGSDEYGVTSVKMQSSEKGTGGLSGGVSGGGIAGIIVAVILVVTIFSTLLFFLMRRNSFATKDEPLHADIELSQSLPPGFMQEISNPAYDATIRGFDNPVYTTTKENLYADPAEVKVDPTGDAKSAYVVEEKGAINGRNWEEDENVKAYTNPMSPDATTESLA